jgi:hypothetical protein
MAVSERRVCETGALGLGARPAFRVILRFMKLVALLAGILAFGAAG